MQAERIRESADVLLSDGGLKLAAEMGEILPQFDEEYCSVSYLNDVLDNRYSFNGEAYDLGECVDWLHNPSSDIEWHILLHKFYYAPGLARAYAASRDDRYRFCFQALVESWIEQVPAGYIAADVTARRIQNWIYAWYLFKNSEADFEREFERRFVRSTELQVDYLIEHMASARNHRTLELYAVFLASIATPDLPSAARWRELSIREMVANIASDLLADGVHCELATDYHHIVLRSYLLFFRLAERNGIRLPASCSQGICRALDFTMHVHRPDGMIPALSDSDSRDFRELLTWGADLFGRSDYTYVATSGSAGRAPSKTNRVFATSGYAILRSCWKGPELYADARYLIFDAGPVGAGNHGHLDALNIEVAAYGKPLIVDPGRYTYHEGGDYNWRAHFRETRAHNTVTVDGESQAIYRQKGARRKIYHPRPQSDLVESRLAGSVPYLHGRVRSPNYDAVHDREIWFPGSRYWVVYDRLSAAHEHDYELHFQLAPSAQGRLTRRAHAGVTEIQCPGLVLVTCADTAEVFVEESFVSTKYGEKCAAPRICIRASGCNEHFLTLLYPFKDDPPVFSVVDQRARHTIVIEDCQRREYWALDQASSQMHGYCSVGDWQLPQESADV